jgi:hypothetical protein
MLWGRDCQVQLRLRVAAWAIPGGAKRRLEQMAMLRCVLARFSGGVELGVGLRADCVANLPGWEMDPDRMSSREHRASPAPSDHSQGRVCTRVSRYARRLSSLRLSRPTIGKVWQLGPGRVKKGKGRPQSNVPPTAVAKWRTGRWRDA